MELTMMTDLYQLTMSNGYFLKGDKNRKMVFDAFFRENPSKGGYAIVCGMDQVIEYIQSLKFTKEDIDY